MVIAIAIATATETPSKTVLRSVLALAVNV